MLDPYYAGSKPCQLGTMPTRNNSDSEQCRLSTMPKGRVPVHECRQCTKSFSRVCNVPKSGTLKWQVRIRTVLYLAMASLDTSANADPALASATLGSYIQVVHSNSIHQIGLVSCQCHGDDVLPLDLFSAQLLPASFKQIRTLFTAQLLDIFCLTNLELKSSAYQFYQLLR